MASFIIILPREIISTIFLHLEQSDCIECMYVCQHWYMLIPDYTTTLWKKLTISPDTWRSTNECLLRCLGPHVRHVSISGISINNIWKILINKGCSVTSLEIKNSKGSRRIDNYYGSDSSNINTRDSLHPYDISFISSLGQFSGTITKLSIMDHPSYISPQRILKQLPLLTHLTLLFGDLKLVPLDIYNPIFKSNIVYLHLDMLCSARPSFHDLLRRCQKLQWLIMSPGSSCYVGRLNLCHILLLCPLLIHILWGISSDEVSINRYWDILSPNPINNDNEGVYIPSNTKKLRYLMLESDEESLNAALHGLVEYQESIECLDINCPQHECYWDNLLPLRLPQLKKLWIRDITVMDTETVIKWAHFFAFCPNVEQIRMLVNLEDGESEINLDATEVFYKAISQLKHLERFESDLWPSRIQHVDIGHFICCNIILTHLELSNTCFSDSGFVALTELQVLQYLALHMDVKHTKCVSTEALLEFADKLKVKSELSDFRLTTLKLFHMDNMIDNVRVRLSHIAGLRFHYIREVIRLE